MDEEAITVAAADHGERRLGRAEDRDAGGFGAGSGAAEGVGVGRALSRSGPVTMSGDEAGEGRQLRQPALLDLAGVEGLAVAGDDRAA